MKTLTSLITLLVAGLALNSFASGLAYPIGGTGQQQCYDNSSVMTAPQPGQPFYGQDAQHPGDAPSYHANGDGTVSDLVTGLTWVKVRGEKMSWEDAMAGAQACRPGRP